MPTVDLIGVTAHLGHDSFDAIRRA